jgi:hypothetical protein
MKKASTLVLCSGVLFFGAASAQAAPQASPSIAGGGPVASAASHAKKCKRIRNKGKRRRCIQRAGPHAPAGYATVGGWSNYAYSTATLQVWNRTSWVNVLAISTGAGRYYAAWVHTGPLPYRYWVTAEYFWSQTYPYPGPWGGTYNCRQTVADDSRYVVTAPGAVYSDLNTTLQPWGPARCT